MKGSQLIIQKSLQPRGLTDSVLKIFLRCLYVLFRKAALSQTKHSKSELPLFLYLYVYVKGSFDLLNIQILIQQQKYVSKPPKVEVCICERKFHSDLRPKQFFSIAFHARGKCCTFFLKQNKY